MSDIVEEMGGYMGDGSEFEQPATNYGKFSGMKIVRSPMNTPTIELVVKYLDVEYADCGSHQLRVNITADREELIALKKTLEIILDEEQPDEHTK